MPSDRLGPALVRRLLERALPEEVRDGIVGDLDEVYRARRSRSGATPARGRLGAAIFISLAAIVLMLSVAGVYSLMSFTVSRRTREIAVRTAVGAARGQIVRAVFGRAAVQLLAGVALGGLIAVPSLLDDVVDEGPRSLLIVSALLLGAGIAACLLPVRRALAIQPAVAMKSE